MGFDWTPLPHVEGGVLAVLLTIALYFFGLFAVLGLLDGIGWFGKETARGYRQVRPKG